MDVSNTKTIKINLIFRAASTHPNQNINTIQNISLAFDFIVPSRKPSL